jgi:hypothetical protein
MKIIITLLLFTIISSSAFAQQWSFATHAGGDSSDYGTRVAFDTEGNSYVVGEFSGTASFDNIQLLGTGKWNLYLAKYSPHGDILWARTVARTTGAGSDLYANALVVDHSGSIYIAGRFSVDVDFSGTTFECKGASDIYLVKLKGDGDLDWVKRAGGVGLGVYGLDAARGIALDSAGNCYITGTYNSDATFDSIAISCFNTTEVFIAKYSSSGNVLWVTSGDGYGFTHLALSIAIDKEGNSYVTGVFFNRLILGDDTLEAVDAEQKMFVAKLDPNGSVVWAERVGSGGYYGSGQDIAVDGNENIYIASYFRAGISFGAKEFYYNNALRYALLTIKYDRNGAFIWGSQSYGADQTATPTKVGLDSEGDLYITGGFSGAVDIGTTHLVSNSGTSTNGFVAKIDPAGNYAWALQIEGPGSGSGSGIAVTAGGDCVVTGTFTGTINLDGKQLVSAGSTDMFLAKITGNNAGVEGDEWYRRLVRPMLR